MESLRTAHGSVLDTAIPASVEVERMGVERTVPARFAPNGRAAAAYEALWRNVRERLGEYPSRAL
jgi:hypothetical protein